MTITMKSIGVAHTDAHTIPRHWSVSDVKGTLVIDEQYQAGLKDIQKGQRIMMIFYFHKSKPFSPDLLAQQPPHRDEKLGVFSICSPTRPNPVGVSVLKVLQVEHNVLHVQGIDMVDGTPILDIKPYVEDKHSCPSCRE